MEGPVTRRLNLPTRLPEVFYFNPSLASAVMRVSESRSIELATGGTFEACGRKWKIEKVSVGPGVERVTAKVAA